MVNELKRDREELKNHLFMLSYRVEKGTGKESVDFGALADYVLSIPSSSNGLVRLDDEKLNNLWMNTKKHFTNNIDYHPLGVDEFIKSIISRFGVPVGDKEHEHQWSVPTTGNGYQLCIKKGCYAERFAPPELVVEWPEECSPLDVVDAGDFKYENRLNLAQSLCNIANKMRAACISAFDKAKKNND